MPKPHHVAAITPSSFPLTTPDIPTTYVVRDESYLPAGDQPEWLPTWLPLGSNTSCLHVLPEVIAEMMSANERPIMWENIGDFRLSTLARSAKGTIMPMPTMQRLCETAQAIQAELNRHMDQNSDTPEPLADVMERVLTMLQEAFAFSVAQIWLAPPTPPEQGSGSVIRGSNTHVPDTVAKALNALARQSHYEQRRCQSYVAAAGVTITALPLRQDQAMSGALVVGRPAQQPLRDDEAGMAELMAMQITGALVVEEKRVAAQISAQFWNTVYDSQPDGFILYDKQHNVTRYSQAALDLAVNRAEVIAARAAGKTVTPVWQTRWPNEAEVSPADAPSMRAIMTGTQTKAAQLWVCPDPAKSQTKIPVLVSASPLVNGDAAIQGAVVRFQDITSMKAVETLKVRLVNNIQHDIRSPLTRVLVSAQMLRKQAERMTPEKLGDYVTGTEAAITTIEAKLNNLADLDNAIGDPPVHMSLVDHVWSYLHDLRQHYGVRRIQCQIEAVDSALEGFWSPREIDSVIDNLIQNAIKYSPEDSSIVVRLFPTRRLDRWMARMEVIDQGYGVAAEDKVRIFDPEYRGVKQTPDGRDIPGTGLGLDICKAAIRLHEGRIGVESTGPGKGSTFYIELPLAR